MIITCPQCKTEYELPSAMQGAEHSVLHCSRCDHQILPAVKPSSVANMPKKPARRIIVVPSKKLEKSRQIDDPARPDLIEKAQMLVSTKHGEAGNEAGFSPITNAKPEIEDLSPPENEIGAVSVTKEEQAAKTGSQPKSRSFREKWLNIAAVIGAILIFGGGLVLRDRVLSVFPSMASIYELAGLDINVYGLEFASVTSKTEVKNGGNILIIEGMIRNISNKTVKVPAVRLLMRAADKQEIYSWFYEPVQMHLEAGETMTFVTRLLGPPSDVKDIHLKFTERRKQQAKLN